MRNVLLCCTWVLACLPASGCKKDVAKAPGAEETAAPAGQAPGKRSAPGAAAAPAAGLEGLGQKLNGYITDCVNRFSASATSATRRYYSWCDRAKGPSAKARIVYGVYTLRDVDACAKAVQRHNAMSPKVPNLEAAGTAYAAALAKLAPVLDEANKYYDQRDYKDDKMAKGKALHPKLVAAFDQFGAANKALYAAIDAQQEKLDANALDQINREEGKKVRWHARNTAMAAKKLMPLNKYPKDLDQAAFSAALKRFDEALTGMEAYVKSAKDDPNASRASSYASDSQKLLKAAKDLYRWARDKEPYSRGEKMNLGGSAEWMVNGSPGAMVNAYNSAVDSYNRMSR